MSPSYPNTSPITRMCTAEELERKLPCVFRDHFSIPTFRSTGIDPARDDEVTYLCGNSLGLMPKSAKNLVNAELDAWAGEGVIGHHRRFDGKDPWVTNDDPVSARLARLVFGCLPSEISYSGTLTSNLNAMLQAFYRPKGNRYKILCEAKAFPSDIYAFQNQVRLRELDPKDALVLLRPREGEDTLRTDDILNVINKEGSSLAVVCLPGIQFYTGQYFDIPKITAASKAVGAVSGWDLAHASGNVPLRLHDWGVDFAVFCSYKYLNGGPGNMGGFFVHNDVSEKFTNLPRPAGWWGVDLRTRFLMEAEFVPAQGARGFAQSNMNLFGPPCMHASLDIVEAAGGIEGLSERRRSLVGFLEAKLKQSKHYSKVFHIMTDKVTNTARGCQLSIKFEIDDESLMMKVVEDLTKSGVIGDERKPNVLRWAPTPLYNTHCDVQYATAELENILDRIFLKC